ncbi:MAG: universal stress protein, partial [Rhodospirillales bacterium]|nr:universal stress protein [Rhodospirillales bacterium]
PYAGTFTEIGRRVLIGWNGRRESARAVNDAIPLMQDSSAVTLLSINPPKEILDKHGEYNRGIIQHLMIHGIKAREIQESNPDVPVANLLVSRLVDESADLLVIGSHSHSGLTQKFKGSVTRDLLQQLTVPALLSH